MHLTRTHILIAVTTAAAVMMSASVASAHVSLRAEPSADCNPCNVTADSIINAGGFVGTTILTMIGGMEVNTGICDDEFNVSINENGMGTMSGVQLHGGATCGKRPCGSTTAESGDGTPWPVEIYETGNGSGEFRAEILLCVVPSSGSASTCHLNDLIVTEINHMIVLDAPHTPCENTMAPNPVIEGLGRWELNGSGFELNHGA
jgi:hypothetical protein